MNAALPYRSRVLVPTLAGLLAACVDRPSTPRGPAPASTPSPMEDSPAPRVVSRRDSAVPQVHLPLRPTPPRAFTGARPLGTAVALAPLPTGGALLAWAQPGTERNMSDVGLRAYGPDGSAGEARLVRSVRGNVRALAVAAQPDDALVVWVAEYGVVAATIAAQRVRRDGTLLGMPITIGTYRVAPMTDAGSLTDALGWFVIAEPYGEGGYVVSVRGPLVPCTAGQCLTVRVAEITRHNDVIGRGGIEHPAPVAPVALVAPPGGRWSITVGVRAGDDVLELRSFGEGPFARLPPLRMTELEAAWASRGQPWVLLRPAQPPAPPGSQRASTEALALYGATAPLADGGIAGRRVTRARMVCASGIAAVEIASPEGAITVPVTDPGAPMLARFALAQGTSSVPAPAARAPLAIAWTGQGLLAAFERGVAFARCHGSSLGPFTATTTP